MDDIYEGLCNENSFFGHDDYNCEPQNTSSSINNNTNYIITNNTDDSEDNLFDGDNSISGSFFSPKGQTSGINTGSPFLRNSDIMDDPNIFQSDGLYGDNEELNNVRDQYKDVMKGISRTEASGKQKIEEARRRLIDTFNKINDESYQLMLAQQSLLDMDNQCIVKNLYSTFRAHCFATLEKCYKEEDGCYPPIFRKEKSLRPIFTEWMRTRPKTDHFGLKNFLKYGNDECEVVDEDEEEIEDFIDREYSKPLEYETLTMSGQIKAQKKADGEKKRPIRQFAENPNTNGGMPFNPVKMRFVVEPGNPKNASSPNNIIEYDVHVEEKKKAITVYIPKKNSRFGINRKDIANWSDLTWKLPLSGDGSHKVPATPAGVYKVVYPEDMVIDEHTDPRFQKRWFKVSGKTPSNQFEQVTITIMGVESLEAIEKVIREGNLRIAVMPKKLRDKVTKMDVVFKELVTVRQVIEANNYKVSDAIIRERRLDIRPMKFEELQQQAEDYVEDELKKNTKYGNIIDRERVKQPLWSFVIRYMHKKGLITDKVLAKFREVLYEKPSKLTPEQYVQAYDAYYWVSLAPDGKKKLEYRWVLDEYRKAGFVVMLINTYLRTGANRGRSSASGELRKFRADRANVYDKLPSKHITEDDQHKKIAVKPVPRDSKSLYNYVKTDSGAIFVSRSSTDPNLTEVTTRTLKRRRVEEIDENKKSKEEWLSLTDDQALDELALTSNDPDLDILNPELAEDKVFIDKKKQIFAECEELANKRRNLNKEITELTKTQSKIIRGRRNAGAPSKVVVGGFDKALSEEQKEILKGKKDELNYADQRLKILQAEFVKVVPKTIVRKNEHEELRVIIDTAYSFPVADDGMRDNEHGEEEEEEEGEEGAVDKVQEAKDEPMDQ